MFGEPSDVAVDAQSLYVLDAGGAALWCYPLTGGEGAEAVGEAEKIPVDPELVGRAGWPWGRMAVYGLAVTPGGFCRRRGPDGR